MINGFGGRSVRANAHQLIPLGLRHVIERVLIGSTCGVHVLCDQAFIQILQVDPVQVVRSEKFVRTEEKYMIGIDGYKFTGRGGIDRFRFAGQEQLAVSVDVGSILVAARHRPGLRQG